MESRLMMGTVLFIYIIKVIIEHIQLKFNCGVGQIINLIYGVIDGSINTIVQISGRQYI
jgi:hypothetical protein